MAKQRLDKRLVELGLAPTRQKAQQMIRAGEVKVNDRVMDKPGMEVKDDAPIVVKEKLQYVSRGGYKLAGALDGFGIEVSDRICLDGGISTGGFTDCLLQRGAKLVYGVDVGYGQVAWEIRQDPRVILKERTNFRHLKPEELYQDQETRADLGVMDLSFISLTKLLLPLWNFLVGDKEVIALIKPQFEVGRAHVGKREWLGIRRPRPLRS